MKKVKQILVVLMFFLAGTARAEDAQDILNKVIQNYSNLKTYSGRVEVLMSLTSDGIENRLSYVSEVTVKMPDKKEIPAMPNKFILKNILGFPGRSIISNGKKIYLYRPLIKRYYEFKTGGKLEILAVDLKSFDKMGVDQFLLFNFFDRENEMLNADGVSIEIYSEEEIDNKIFYILSFKNKIFDMKVWIEKETYYLKKIVMIITTFPEGTRKEVELIYEEKYSDVILNEDISDVLFKFIPPAGTMLGTDPDEDLIEAPDFPYPGKNFIDFEILIVGKKDRVKLSQLRGVVTVLVFWEDSEYSKILMKYLQKIYIKNPDEIKIIALNSRDRLKDVKKFIRRNKITYPVAIDSDGWISSMYGATIYPTLFVIGKDSKIAQIYSGYFSGLERRITEDLKLLLEGFNLNDYNTTSKESKGVYKKWQSNVKASGITVNQGIIAASPKGEMYRLSSGGSIEKVVSLRGAIRKIELLNPDKPSYIGFRPGGSNIIVFDGSGKKLWEREIKLGVNNIEVSDLNGDNSPEIILAQNGQEGVRVMNDNGKTLWVSTEAAQVWRVSAGDITGDGSNEVAAVSNDGVIYIFNAHGKVIREIKTNIYPNFIKIIRGKRNILISGSVRENEILSLLDAKGETIWEVILGDAYNSGVESVSQHPLNDWIAVGTLDGQVFIFDSIANVIAYTKEDGLKVSVKWMEASEGEVSLLTATVEGGINSYHIESK